MDETRRETLLGYLLGALEEDESRNVRRELERNESDRVELATLRRELRPLSAYSKWSDKAIRPPQGLAERTCRNLWDRIDSGLGEQEQFVNTSLPVPVAAAETSAPPPSETTAEDSVETSQRRKLPRVYAEQRSHFRFGRWKSSDAITICCLGIMFLFLLIPGISFVKNQIVQVVIQSRVKKIADNTAAMTQLHESYSFFLTKGKDDSYTSLPLGTDLGSLLSSFGETNLSQKTLTLLPRNAEASIGTSNSSPLTFISLYSVANPELAVEDVESPPLLKRQYAPSFPFPQVSHLFDPVAASSQSQSSQATEFTFADWGNAGSPVFVKASGGQPQGTLLKINEGQNLFYRDGRVFFRRSGAGMP